MIRNLRLENPMNMRTLLISALILILAGCAALNQDDPLRISVAGIQPLEGRGMEARFDVQLRIQNHGNKPLAYDGIAFDLDLRGMSFASGVSDQQGVIPRFGETVITVPVTVPATAILRQVFQIAASDSTVAMTKVDYQLRGRLGGPGLTLGRRFDSTGEMTLPAAGPEETRPAP
jgi:LEA14-like dessication related protein